MVGPQLQTVILGALRLIGTSNVCDLLSAYQSLTGTSICFWLYATLCLLVKLFLQECQWIKI